MDAQFYNELLADVNELLQEFGQTVILARKVNGSTVTYNTIGAVTNFDDHVLTNVGSIGHRIANSEIAIGDDILYLQSAVEPLPTDRITYNGMTRVIADPVVVINPAGIKMVYKVIARNG